MSYLASQSQFLYYASDIIVPFERDFGEYLNVWKAENLA